MPDNIEISVVVPVYRNAATVEQLYVRLCRELERHIPAFEIIFVDDACPEESLAILGRLAREDRRVGVIAMARNVGQQRATMTGLAHARGRKSRSWTPTFRTLRRLSIECCRFSRGTSTRCLHADAAGTSPGSGRGPRGSSSDCWSP